MKPRILITGSSGMLSMDLARELSKSYKIIGTDVVSPLRGGSALLRTRSSLVVGKFYRSDITDRKAIADVIKKAKPAIVVHTAAWTDVDGCEFDRKKAYAINADGTRNVVLACKTAKAGLIYVSTDFVFDGKSKRPYREDDRTNPLSVYADSKLKGELAVKKTLKEHFILRTSWLFGKYGKNFVDTMIAKAKDCSTLRVVDDQVGSPTYTVDLAKAIHILLDKFFTMYDVRSTMYGTYHVSNSGSVSWYEYARTILKIAGIKAEVLPISSKELARPAKRPAMSAMDSSKFEKVTGHRMRGWKSALREYLRRKNGRSYAEKA